jgi:formate C-acetyltransferase
MSELTYHQRIVLLREKKVADTLGKIRQNGFMDVDDYGTVPLPEGWQFTAVPNHANGGFYGLAGWSSNYAALLDAHPVYVEPLEILCGRWMAMLPSWRKPWPQDLYPYDDLKAEQQLYGIISGIGADSHFSGDYQLGLALGFGGIIEKIRRCRAANPARSDFYDAEEQVYLAVQRWIGRHIDQIGCLLANEQRPEIRATLQAMLASNRRVISEVPQTFLEACQWMAWMACASRIYDRDGAGCLLDSVLYPYYQNDLVAGKIDADQAKFILANLLLIDPHYYQLSGADKDGQDLTNPLSYLILEAAHWLNAPANLTIRMHKHLDPVFFRKSVEYLFNDRNGWPRFSGDQGLMGYLQNSGIDLDTARSRIAVGCNWMAVPGREYPMNDCVKINVVKVFEVAYQEMMDSGVYSLDGLWALLQKHLARAVAVTAAGINFHLEHQHKVTPELMLNPLMEDTLEKGLDISQCAQLFTIGLDGVGLGTVADSLAALEQRVVIEKKAAWEEIHAAITADFAGCERLRLMLASAPRYCQGNSLGDQWARNLSRLFSEMVHNQPMPRGRQLVPGWFSWSNTIMFGKQVGATPNGRRAFTPVTHGANPTPGFRQDGAATAMATGIARIQPGYGNPAPLQIELDPHLSAEEGGIERVMTLLKTHVDMGGTLININVLDKQKLLAAHKDPMQYPDLVVRVTGFTAYFMALSPEFRQLVVDRFIDGGL